MDIRYKELRKAVVGKYNLKNKVEASGPIYSPSGKYYLIISIYKTGEATWSYSRGIIKETKSGRCLGDVKRNHPSFWYTWCAYGNNDYLLCGEDYQGQTIVNLTKRTTINYFPEAAYNGHGFCWVNAMVSPCKKYLAIEGCYWAGPYDLVFYDFSTPEQLPYNEIKRIEDIGAVKGWDLNGYFIVEKELEIRKSDGVEYSKLTEEEQDILDNNATLLDDITIVLKIKPNE